MGYEHYCKICGYEPYDGGGDCSGCRRIKENEEEREAKKAKEAAENSNGE